MKIAVTSRGTDLDSAVDPRFGRAAYILIIDSDTRTFEVLDNQENVDAFQGAGIQAAVMISDKGADVLLTGYCGPKAFETLQAAGIKVVNDAVGTVDAVVRDFKDGKFSFAQSANVEGHW